MFKITERIEIVCDWKKTRNGFKHEATLFLDGRESDRAKCCYLNRTWESYEYQSVMKELIHKTKSISDKERELCKAFIEKDHTDWSQFRTTAMVANLGEILCDSQKEKNDWKTRMLNAGLGNRGLQMPDDWESLDEETRTARLDAVIKLMGEKHGN